MNPANHQGSADADVLGARLNNEAAIKTEELIRTGGAELRTFKQHRRHFEECLQEQWREALDLLMFSSCAQSMYVSARWTPGGAPVG